MTTCYWCGAKDTLTDIGKELDDGKYKMVQCQKCKNAYYVVNKEKVNKPKPLTNEEYIRSCSTEELAKLIYKIAVTDVLMDRFFTAEVVNAEIVDVDSGIKEAETWLKEKHDA
jgi:hypothetical protein